MPNCPTQRLQQLLLLTLLGICLGGSLPQGVAANNSALNPSPDSFSKVEARVQEDSKLSAILLSDQFGPLAYHLGTFLAKHFGKDNPLSIGLIEYAATSSHAELQYYVASNYYTGNDGFNKDTHKALYWSLRALQDQESPFYKDLALMTSSIAETEIPNSEAALRYAQRCIDIQPDGACYYRKARLLEDQGQLEAAIPVYKSGDAQNDDYSAWRLGLYYLETDLTQAEHFAKRALAKSNPLAYSLMADVHLHRYFRQTQARQDLDAAIRMADLGIRHNDISSYARKGYALNEKASLQQEPSLQRQALEVLEQGIHHGDAESALQAAQVYRSMGKAVEALAYLQLYHTVSPESSLPGDLSAYRDYHQKRLSTFQRVWVSAHAEKLAVHYQH